MLFEQQAGDMSMTLIFCKKVSFEKQRLRFQDMITMGLLFNVGIGIVNPTDDEGWTEVQLTA